MRKSNECLILQLTFEYPVSMDTGALESLSDTRRLAIVDLLADGERCLCDVSSALGISNALASHHLKRLRESGIVVAERRGVWLHCRLAPDALDTLACALSTLASRARESDRSAPRCCVPPSEDGAS